VRSFSGSNVRTALRHCRKIGGSPSHNCVAILSSRVERMGWPSGLMMMTPKTPLCALIRLSVSSTAAITIVPLLHP